MMFGDCCRVEVQESGVDGAASYFEFRRADETEFAYGETALFVGHRWTEGAAGDGARRVEVAGAGKWVEDGAGLVVSEIFKGFFVMRFGEELAGEDVARKAAGEATAGF